MKRQAAPERGAVAEGHRRDSHGLGAHSGDNLSDTCEACSRQAHASGCANPAFSSIWTDPKHAMRDTKNVRGVQMLVRTKQTNGGPIIIQSDQVVYLRQISTTATGVVVGAKGFSEFAISVDDTVEGLVQAMSGAARQTNGSTVAINNRHIRYARGEGEATVFVLGSRGGEEFAVSVDIGLDAAVEALESDAPPAPVEAAAEHTPEEQPA
jgi:hypothetical protein